MSKAPSNASTTVFDGRKFVTTAGTPVALVSGVTPAYVVDITAETDNTGLVVVGASTVVASLSTRRGVPLNAGDTYTVADVDLSTLFIDSTVSTDGVSFTYVASA